MTAYGSAYLYPYFLQRHTKATSVIGIELVELPFVYRRLLIIRPRYLILIPKNLLYNMHRKHCVSMIGVQKHDTIYGLFICLIVKL